MRPWSPLLSGSAAAEVLAEAEAIARDLLHSAEPGFSLNRGAAGRALLFAYLGRASGQGEWEERAEEELERAIDGLSEAPAPAADLYAGFAGVAWAVEHLMPGQEDDPDDPNGEIDDALLALLGQSPWTGEVDLLGGLVGWGVYALERLPRPAAAAMLSLVVERLGEALPGRQLDAGMAHGTAGVIALLARILEEAPENREAAALLAGLSASEDPEGDLAWCAGDAGLAVARLAAGQIGPALRSARAAAARYPDDAGSRGFDPALCHGTAGLSHLFHRLHQATGEPGFRDAAERWLRRTRAQRRPGKGFGGYLSRGRLADRSVGWIADPGFLGGAVGIGLALLAAASPVEPAWDRLLLLSGREPR